MRPRIGITLGDPAGIGPEVVLKALIQDEIPRLADYVLVGHQKVLHETAGTLEDEGPAMKVIADVSEAGGEPSILEVGTYPKSGVARKEVSAEAGRLAVGYVLKAIELAKAGAIDAIVTAPIHKEAILRAGYNFPGHTEILARETNTRKYVMMLVGGPLRVALVTIHVALRKVFGLITKQSILDTIRVTHKDLVQYFGVPAPRIGVCGLNPHAGDGGRFGDEEAKIIGPAIEEARAGGLDCRGPLPPDTAFYQAANGAYDVMIAMYHDQGLIPLKLVGFETGVNVTLGLPIIRTSVDHGTAFDIVGRNCASAESMVEAIKLAVRMAEARRQ